MKCIKYKSNEVVARVKDYEAARAVASGSAHYVPKHTWKSYCNEHRAELIAIAREAKAESLEERQKLSTAREAKKAEARVARRRRREEYRRKQYSKAA